MTATAQHPLLPRSSHRRELPGWAAGMLAIAGNVLLLAIVGVAVVATLAAGAIVFGPELLAQL